MRTLSVLLVLTLAAAASAQERRTLRHLPGPLPEGVRAADLRAEVVHATYDMATGEIRAQRNVPAGGIALGAAPCFDNSLLVCGTHPFAPYTIGDFPGDELLDWGIKDCGGSGFVTALTIAYRTTALDPADGGPGATLSFGLYRGTRGFNRVGTEIFRRTFTGLPAQAAPAGSLHEAPFVFLTLDFSASPLFLADGPIGWGYMLLDNANATFSTGALLVVAPNDETSVIDALDVFSPGPASTGTYIGTFNFGTLCNHPPCCPDASTWLQIVEAPSGSTVVNGSGTNPEIFAELLPPRLGQVWVTRFDLTAHPTTFATLILSSGGALAPRPTRFGELLIDPGLFLGPPLLAQGMHLVPVPADPVLDGFVVHTQGLIRTTGGSLLTNGLDLTLGF